MRIRIKPKRCRADIDPKTQALVSYLAHTLGVTIPTVLRMAVREFSVRRLDPDWEEVSKQDEEYRREVYRKWKSSRHGGGTRTVGGPVRRPPKPQVKGGSEG